MGFAWEISIQGLVIVNPIDQYLTCNLGTKAKHIYIRSAVDTCKVSKKKLRLLQKYVTNS